MNDTSLSLLARLRRSPESESWNRLVDLYAPLIRAWLRKYDVQDSDADDLVQEVLLAVSKDLAKFEHRGQLGAFRGWLKAILVNRLRKFWRARDRRPQARGDSDIDARLAELDDPASEMSVIWNREHDQYVLRQLSRRASLRHKYLDGILSRGIGWGKARRCRRGNGNFPECRGHR
jgi:RNA polymerase sigma-70 factor (ECF subfamily)